MRVILVGAGRVGTATCVLLRAAGHDIVGVASRSEVSARRAAARLECPIVELGSDPLPVSDLIFIGAGDDAIGSVARALSETVGPDVVCSHFAGALGTAPLQPLVDAGARACALHPVQACPDVDTAVARLPGSAWGVTASGRETEERMSAIVRHDLAGHPFSVAESDRALWHAAAVTTSNGIAALLGAGAAILGAIGIERTDDVLGPLASGTIANAGERGAWNALTGPVVRGEAATLARHIESLTDDAPHLVEVYRRAVRLIAESAVQAGRIDEDARAAVEAAVSP